MSAVNEAWLVSVLNWWITVQEKQQPEATDVELGDDESASGVQVRRWIVHFGKDCIKLLFFNIV